MTCQPDLEGLGFETNAVHGGESPDAATGAINTPVYLSSTFQQDAVGQHRGFEYARSGNPSRASLERHLALLEAADFGFAFASGLAAEDAVMRLLSPGDHLVMQTDSYGGTSVSYTHLDVYKRQDLAYSKPRCWPTASCWKVEER